MKLTALKKQKGFTLIELLVVIGILAILLTIVLVAVNPAAQFAQANNTKRQSDVTAILNAIGQYSADNKGNLTALSLPAAAANIGSNTAGGQVDICAELIPEYISSLPADPDATQDSFTDTECAVAAGYDTLYTVFQDASGRVTVAATPDEVRGVTTPISVTR